MTADSDSRLQDWAECRTTIGRLDTILADLRRYSFTVITGFIAAGGFLNLLGMQADGKTAAPSEVRAATIIVVFVLIACIFAVDNYYQVLLSGAVERAMDIEAQTPDHRLSWYMARNVQHTQAPRTTLWLYLMLLSAAGILALAMFPGYLKEGIQGGSFSGAFTALGFGCSAWFIRWVYLPTASLLYPQNRRVLRRSAARALDRTRAGTACTPSPISHMPPGSPATTTRCRRP